MTNQLNGLGVAVTSGQLQFLILVGLSFGVVALTALAYFSDRLVFEKFLGRLNPLLASLGIVLIGGILLIYFVLQGWFVIFKADGPIRFLWLSGLAFLLAVIMILVDLKISFPEDLNVAFPQSLLFYPVVGYAAEILFHMLPLFILLTLLTSLSNNISFTIIAWLCIIIVSSLEPIYQTMPLASKYPNWASFYVALQLFVFNIIQLALFNQYDFITMYSFRLVYYLIWHIVWGHIRIRLLFNN